MYADVITKSMANAISETNRRRKVQLEYNAEHGITPKSIQKGVRDLIEVTKVAEDEKVYSVDEKGFKKDKDEIQILIEKLKKEMKEAAKDLQFERAAELRDKISKLSEYIVKETI